MTLSNYAELLLTDRPLLDVRAPVEFAQGAFPAAVNLPLMTDDERAAVGTLYKQQGQQAAIELGHQLVQGEVLDARVAAWIHQIQQQPNTVLYCFRGGLRSRLVQQAVQSAGYSLPFVEGGYKALRSFLLSELSRLIQTSPIWVLSGPTGSGKTDLLRQWPHSVDLESLAEHRGSAFGQVADQQPSQISFENAWAIEWLKREKISSQPVLFEDESRLIGQRSLMPEFLAKSKTAPTLRLVAPMSERIDRIVEQYGQPLQADSAGAVGNRLRSGLQRIRKRLGGARYQSLMSATLEAEHELKHRQCWQGFRDIIETLLVDYYDPMYDYQQQQRTSPPLFVGSAEEILAWLHQHQ